MYDFTELKGRYFDEESINDNDMFVPDNTAFSFVTEKVKKLLTDAKFTNLEFVPNTEFTSVVSVELYKPPKPFRKDLS